MNLLRSASFLSTEAVQSAALAFESVNHIHGCDSLALGVLRVRNGVTDNVFQENLENAAGLFVDQTRDSFDTTSTGEATDGRLGDTLDVISENFTVTLGASFSKTFPSFTTTRHVEYL